MRILLEEVSVTASKEFELIKITDQVRKIISNSGIENGIVHVITEHTTTGITVNESLLCVEKDILSQLDLMFPDSYPYVKGSYIM